jgi:hypothetical protein
MMPSEIPRMQGNATDGEAVKDCDPGREAQSAMTLALAAEGYDRLHWIRVALPWQELGRGQDRGRDKARDGAGLTRGRVEFSSCR